MPALAPWAAQPHNNRRMGDHNVIARVVQVCILASMATTSVKVRAADSLAPQHLLATAKMAGACGILDSMIQLQSTTKLSGGEEFVARFWSVEAARLGMTVAQLSETCTKSIKAYDQLWKAAEPPRKQ